MLIAYPFSQIYKITATFQDHLDRDPPSTAPGIDFAAPLHTPIIAPFAGKVRSSRWYSLGGRGLWIQNPDDTVRVYYAHLQCLCTLLGETVEPAQIVGYTGTTGHSTGPHLHLSVKIDGEYVDPMPLLNTEVNMTDQPLWKLQVPDTGSVQMEAAARHIEVIGMAPAPVADTMPDALRDQGYRFLQVPRNEGAALLKYARANHMGAAITPEFYIDFQDTTYCCQGFAQALVYAVKGQWGDVKHLDW